MLGFGGAEPDFIPYCSGPAQKQRSHQPQGLRVLFVAGAGSLKLAYR